MDFENEIEVLESTLEYLESAIVEVADSPYHSYLSNTWELDATEIKARLEELYELQNDQWAKEMQEQNFEYERSVL